MADPLQQSPQLSPAQQAMLNSLQPEWTKGVAEMPPRTEAPPARPIPFRPVPEPVPGPARMEHVNPALLETAQAVSRIVATRLLLLIAVVTTSAIWGTVIYEPTPLGIYAAGVYSVVGMWPLVFLYLRKG